MLTLSHCTQQHILTAVLDDTHQVIEEYFYVFSDVVVRGRALWRDKFKHKETLDVLRVEDDYSSSSGTSSSSRGGGDFRHSQLGIASSSRSLPGFERCFRLVHMVSHFTAYAAYPLVNMACLCLHCTRSYIGDTFLTAHSKPQPHIQSD
jgi:hypothetical protein